MEDAFDAILIAGSIAGLAAICIRWIVSTETWNRRVLKREPPLDPESEFVKSLLLVALVLGAASACEAVSWVMFGGTWLTLGVVLMLAAGSAMSVLAAVRRQRAAG
jgi:hypothetical protein